MLDLVGDNGHVVWCDHHITAIDRYQKDKDLCLEGIRSTKYCGAALIWCYFNDIDTEDIETISYEELTSRMPKWLRLVDAWDCWKLDSQYREEAEALNIAIGSRLNDENFDEYVNHFEDYISVGFHYINFRDSWSKQLRDKYMFKKVLPGYIFNSDRKEVTAAILNLGCANSSYFGDTVNEVDVCVTMCFNGTSWSVSLYSNKDYVDCSYCAKMHGGGGHKGAAGCSFKQVSPPAFVLDKDEQITIVKEKK